MTEKSYRHSTKDSAMALIVEPIFVLILLFLSPNAKAQQEQPECDIPGECVGVLISVSEASNTGECVISCQHVTGCAWYTFYPTDGLCTLHEQCGAVSEDCEDCMSGQDTCPACNVGGECEGINFHLEPDVEEQQCLVLCEDSELCYYYSYSKEDRYCLLFTSCPSLTLTPCPSCVTGQPGCTLGEEEPTTTPIVETTTEAGAYIIVTSGSTCERVTSKAECEEAARQLGLSDTIATAGTAYSYPPYCINLYINQIASENLYFNNNGDSETGCSPDYACICKKEPSTSTSSVAPSTTTPSVETTTPIVETTTTEAGEYIIVTSGSTCERVTSKEECEEAARQLGLSDTTAAEETSYSYPPYCYFYNGSSLYFNNQLNSDTVCSSYDPCICKKAI